jgi:hypothetical protein
VPGVISAPPSHALGTTERCGVVFECWWPDALASVPLLDRGRTQDAPVAFSLQRICTWSDRRTSAIQRACSIAE